MASKTGRLVHTPHVAGAHVGPFVLDRFLGGGADTAVWRAVGDGIVVALKLVRDRSDSIAVARLAHEALALDLVRHPSVVHRFDADDSDGESWLATALLDAGTLAQRLNAGLLDAGEAAAALAPIAEALAAAHDVGVVHRDVNPANVVLGADGPVLIDFGHAAIGGHTWDGWTATGARAVARTHGFAAPETEVSPAIDVYSLGITLLEAVTGRRTLESVELDSRAGADHSLHVLVAECCAADPAQRSSMLEVATRLRSIARGAAAPHQPAPPPVVDVISAEADEDADLGGRRAELTRLSQVARRALDRDELAAMLVVAPAGTGKSWLLDRALEGAHRDFGLTARRTRCTTDVRDLRVLRPIVEPDLDDPRVGVAGAAILRGAIGAHGASAEASPRDVAEAAAAVLRLRPVAVLVDDLHWADSELIEVLSRLAFRHETPGVLLLGTRPGFVDPDDLDVETLALGPLDDHSLRAALSEIGDEDVVTAAAALSGGNPLHAREAALALAAGVELDAATDLRGVVAARLAAVDTSLSPALALAAASGDGFWPEILGDELRAQVPKMVRAGYARPRLRSSVAGSTEFEWAHPLLREVAYERLDTNQRRNLHSHLAQRLDIHPNVDPETIARHAGIAYRLGDHTLTALTARSAAASVREALDHYAVNRAADWATLLQETRHDPDLADILTAEVKNRQGDFSAALDLLLPHTERDDEIATRALTIGTETLVGLAHYEQAVQWGTRARDQLKDRDPIARSINARPLAIALRECSRLDEALSELDEASEAADRAGNPLLGTRLAAEATTIAAMQTQHSGTVSDSIARARGLVRRLHRVQDRRSLVELATSSVADSIAIEEPLSAFEIQVEAFELSLEYSDPLTLARAARRLIEVSWDAERPDGIARALPVLLPAGLPAAEQSYFELVGCLATASLGEPDHDLGEKLSRYVRRLDDANVAAFSDQQMALCAFAYAGRLHALNDALNSFRRRRAIPRIFETFAVLNLALLAGPPFAEPATPPATTAFNNERAALAYLRDDRAQGDALLRERAEFLRSSGNTHQGYSTTYCGALFGALGPPECDPPLDRARHHILRTRLPGIWTFQRAVLGLLLGERDPNGARDLVVAARALRDSINPDPSVAAWYDERLARLT